MQQIPPPLGTPTRARLFRCLHILRQLSSILFPGCAPLRPHAATQEPTQYSFQTAAGLSQSGSISQQPTGLHIVDSNVPFLQSTLRLHAAQPMLDGASILADGNVLDTRRLRPYPAQTNSGYTFFHPDEDRAIVPNLPNQPVVSIPPSSLQRPSLPYLSSEQPSLRLLLPSFVDERTRIKEISSVCNTLTDLSGNVSQNVHGIYQELLKLKALTDSNIINGSGFGVATSDPVNSLLIKEEDIKILVEQEQRCCVPSVGNEDRAAGYRFPNIN